MVKEFYDLDELKEYYNEETNTYEFKEDNKYIGVVFNFDLKVEANIVACRIDAKDISVYNIKSNIIDANDIKAISIKADSIYSYNIKVWDINVDDIRAGNIDASYINAKNINADDIRARNIKADNISYYGVCYAYENIICNSIEGRRQNAKHFVLDGSLTIKNI